METTVENEKLNFEKVWAMFQETGRRLKETDELLSSKFLETGRRLKETDELLSSKFLETDRRFKETDELLSSKFLETDRQFKETEKSIKETGKQIKELGKQIGGLGNKFGTFNEGLVLPSLYKLFKNKFHCTEITERYKFFTNGDSMEIDLLAISDDSCFIIEIKSHYKSDAIEQLQKQIERFRKIKKEYADRKIYGVIVATHYDKNNIRELFSNGIYFISISDDLVNLQLPDNFEPRAW